LWAGVAAGLTLVIVVHEAPYLNWKPVVAPVQTHVLQMRQDAKGDGRFGAPRSGQRSHRGIDLLAPLNSPVRAIRSGTVTEVGTHRGLGHFVEVSHGGGLTSLYAHLASTTVEKGDRVVQGHMIGAVGKTGNARHPWISPHLHLEVARRGEVVDPATIGLQVLASTPRTAETTDGRGGD
jgi:murein DD-endopeptidase MepM/ murein hydrolase activator NlpD